VDKVVLTPVSTSASTSTPSTDTTTTTTPGTSTSTTTTTPSTSTSTTTTPIIGGALGSVSPVTIEAESMSLSSYAVENARWIKLTSSVGTASKSFSGASGTYNMQVYVVTETDGQSTLEVYKGSTLLRKYTYPLGNAI